MIVLPPHRDRLHLLSPLERRSGHTDCPQLLLQKTYVASILSLRTISISVCVYIRHLSDILSAWKDRSCRPNNSYVVKNSTVCVCVILLMTLVLTHKRRLSKHSLIIMLERTLPSLFVIITRRIDQSNWLLAPRSEANRNANYQLISICCVDVTYLMSFHNKNISIFGGGKNITYSSDKTFRFSEWHYSTTNVHLNFIYNGTDRGR